jgi:hypothetical protein
VYSDSSASIVPPDSVGQQRIARTGLRAEQLREPSHDRSRGLSSAALERAHPARRRTAALRLDEQVHVRALDAEVHDAEVLAPQHGDRGLADRHVRIARAQPADALLDADRDVNRFASRLRPCRSPALFGHRISCCT